MNRLTVSKIQVAQNQLRVSFDCKGQIRKFFIKDKFIAEYDTPVEKVPEAILIIPFLATICPIAWANQAEVFVETVDATFLSSLDLVRKTLQKFYPQMKFINKVQVKNIVPSPVESRLKRMLLFSGGIDSLATFIRHQDENPILVSVQEADFASDDKEEQNMGRMTLSMNIASEYLEKFCSMVKSESRIIRSNWIFVLDSFMLGMYLEELQGDWYARVMHGLAFSGLCAPLAYIKKVDKLYIASSFTAEAQIPWGSHPDIDNNVKWTGTKVEHDGYELSRQDKMFLIADYIKNNQLELQIRSCSPGRDLGKNCSRCEKCSRTILGLELAGIDPNKHGFSVDAETFSDIKINIANRTWRFGDDEVYMWTDLQKHASNAKEMPHHEAKVLIDWLSNINVESLRAKPIRSRRVNPFFKMLPYPLFKLTKKLYLKLNERFYP